VFDGKGRLRFRKWRKFEVGKMEENLGLKMLSKIARENVCIVLCVFKNREEAYLYWC